MKHNTESLLVGALETIGKVVDKIDLCINSNSTFDNERELATGTQKKTFRQLKGDCISAIDDLKVEFDHIIENRSRIWKDEELEKHGYEPCNRHLNIYPDDFSNLSVWDEVLQCLGLESSDGVTLAVAGIKDEREKDTAPVDENEKIIRAWNDDDDYVLKVKTVLGNIERSTLKANAINSISGGYAIAEITGFSTDVFDDETEVEVDNFHLEIRFGVKSDCNNWYSTCSRRLDCNTLAVLDGSGLRRDITTTSVKDVLERLKKIQAIDLNIVTCGDCGLVHIVDHENELIECSKCGFTGEHCDYPDLLSESDLLNTDEG
jgi:hypothetical protein